MSAIRSRRAADRTRSRGFLPRAHSEARLEGTPTQSLNMKSAGSVRSRPQCHCRHPHDCRGHHGGFCITRTRHGVSTSPCGVGTSPTAASGATPGRQWSSATSSGGAQRLCILRRYPYPVYGTAGPVGGGPRGDYRRIVNACLLGGDEHKAQGCGVRPWHMGKGLIVPWYFE